MTNRTPSYSTTPESCASIAELDSVDSKCTVDRALTSERLDRIAQRSTFATRDPDLGAATSLTVELSPENAHWLAGNCYVPPNTASHRFDEHPTR